MMQRFEPLDVAEARVLTFDYSGELADGETLTAILSIEIDTADHGAAPPDDIRNGTPELHGAAILVPVKGAGVVFDYSTRVRAATSNPKKILVAAGILPVVRE